jgi:hypothetical protein
MGDRALRADPSVEVGRGRDCFDAAPLVQFLCEADGNHQQDAIAKPRQIVKKQE